MRSRFDQRWCRATVQAWADRRFRPPSCGLLAGWQAGLLDCRHGGMSLAGSSFRRQRQMACILPWSDAPTSFASLECRMTAMDQCVRRPIRAIGFLVLDLATLAVGRAEVPTSASYRKRGIRLTIRLGGRFSVNNRDGSGRFSAVRSCAGGRLSVDNHRLLRLGGKFSVDNLQGGKLSVDSPA